VSGNPASVTHVYPDGTRTVTISATATDEDGTFSANTKSVTVNNLPPVVSANSVTGNEGSAVTFTATFTDAGSSDTHTATIWWGDGASGTYGVTEPSGGNPGSVTATHTYADNGNYTVRVDVRDNDGGVGSTSKTAAIANRPPV